ncbi:fibronectin type III domain-containing protein, partial [Syntrophomonas palmitatica]|uniref:fibronectin type III domain-containing protein n=1 Tax=Syntrophomonas palmitatica TaxID=402877 RepID=UPI000A42784C
MLARAGPGRKKHHAPAPDGGQHAVYHKGLRRRKRFASQTIIKRDTLYIINTDAAAYDHPAASLRDTLYKDLESKPGGLTITWYSAMRFNDSTTSGDTNPYSRLSFLYNTFAWTYLKKVAEQIFYEQSNKAYHDRDRSVCLGSEPFSVDSYKADKWLLADNLTSMSEAHNCYVWGEVSGYFKVPYESDLFFDLQTKGLDILFDSYINYQKRAMGFGKWGAAHGFYDNRLYGEDPGLKYIKGSQKGEMVPFTLYIGKMRMEPNEKIGAISIDISSYYGGVRINKRIPAENFYSQLSLKDMQSFFVFNPDDYTLTLDPIHKTFPVKDYEYGIVSGEVNDYSVETATGFQPLQLGVNHVTPDSGTLVIRHKQLKTWYISVGTAYLDKPRDMKITRRTPTTCTLSWKAPLQIVPDGYKIRYDIYRRETGHNPKLVFSSGMAISNESALAGSTTDLTFTDKELKYGSIYEYFVKAAYPTGFSAPSDIVNTDSVAMEEIPSTPTDLKAVLGNQTNSEVDLKLSWSAPEPRVIRTNKDGRIKIIEPIKEYIIYRYDIKHKSPIYSLDPQERARTKYTSYIERGCDLNDIYEYYVQSVEGTGNRSYFSSPLKVSIKDLIASTPKIAPD